MHCDSDASENGHYEEKASRYGDLHGELNLVCGFREGSPKTILRLASKGEYMQGQKSPTYKIIMTYLQSHIRNKIEVGKKKASFF